MCLQQRSWHLHPRVTLPPLDRGACGWWRLWMTKSSLSLLFRRKQPSSRCFIHCYKIWNKTLLQMIINSRLDTHVCLNRKCILNTFVPILRTSSMVVFIKCIVTILTATCHYIWHFLTQTKFVSKFKLSCEIIGEIWQYAK